MNNTPSVIRVRSIDILRAITMFLMIFVNDLWTSSGVPKWMLHAKAGEDYLGLSDIVFPLFLFIVGLSIPFAVANRRSKGDSDGRILLHVFIRSFSLIIMGVYMVNREYMYAEGIPFSRHIWSLLMATGMVLIWMDWKRTGLSPKLYRTFQAIGLLLMIYIAAIYQGGSDGSVWMKPYWWGILGLIGWAYLANSLVYVLSKGRIVGLVISLLFFTALNIADAASLIPSLGAFRFLGVLVSGSTPVLTAAGLLASVILIRSLEKQSATRFFMWMAILSVVFLVYGFALRPLWGISKLSGSPSWVGICSAMGFAFIGFFYWMADVKGVSSWAKIIAPAGTATLTCYMLPYFIYPVRSLGNLVLPELWRVGLLGIVLSLIFAWLVIWVTGWFEKKKFKLKL